jgi:hypothetical protein
VLHYFLKP